MSDCSDPQKTWYPQRVICYATRDAEAARRKYAALHSEASGRVFHEGAEREWVAKRDDAHPFHFSDGVTVFVTEFDANPDDRFLSGGEPPDHQD